MIQIQELSYRFRGSEQYALRDVSLKVRSGEFVVLTGPSGCGKSTLALAIGGYLFRQFDGEASGSVAVAGMNVRDCPIYDVAEVVGLVQQNPEAQFCTLTVRDEVAFGLENRRLPRTEILERLAWALDIVGAGHLADRDLATLSGGERQKVAIAAMMAAKPQVLIFDEPTSNLDPTATREIFRVIEQIRDQAGITVLVIEHKVDYLRHFDPRLVSMDHGQIVHDGAMAKASTESPCAGQGRKARTSDDLRRVGDNPPTARIQNLCAGYNGQPVLRDVCLELQPGEFLSVMGDNGSGKTTFLHSLMGLLKPDQGHVEVCGQDTKSTPVSRLAQKVGFVFQNPDHQIFADSIWQEATFALHNLCVLNDANETQVQELLIRCGLGDRLEDHPYRLSYGQKRRLNLVSVLSYNPKLILLDEVLIGQDPANARFLLDLLQEHVAAGATVIMVNHAPEVTRRYASRVLFFNDGRILVDAPTEQAYERLRAMGRESYAT